MALSMRPSAAAGIGSRVLLLPCSAAHDPDRRRKARARHQVRQGRVRHRGHRGPDRDADAPHQRSHRAPARAQARSPLPPRPADAGRAPPPLPELPPAQGPGGVPLADPRARPAPVAMAPIEAGQPAPEFSLATYEGDRFTREELLGRITVLVFYPFAFSPICTDQLAVYEEVLEDFSERGVTLYGVSCDSVWAQQAFREKLGITIEQLSDFEPKGEACRAFGVLHPGGFPQRALVMTGPDGVVLWSHQAASPGELPGANLIFDALDAVSV